MTTVTTSSTPIPDNIVTSYDVAKSLAIVLMLADHIGFYFFPEALWLRALGRLCVPLWFFLIGYSQSQRLPYRFLIGAVLLVLVDGVLGRPLLPLNILFTMILIRLILRPMMHLIGRRPVLIYLLCFVGGGLLYLPTNYVIEYGTIGLLLAMIGYMTRARTYYGEALLLNTAFIVLTLTALDTYLSFNFPWPLQSFVTAGFAIGMSTMIYFFPRPLSFPYLEASRILRISLQFMGRRTLEIYVAHLALFKIVKYFLFH